MSTEQDGTTVNVANIRRAVLDAEYFPDEVSS